MNKVIFVKKNIIFIIIIIISFCRYLRTHISSSSGFVFTLNRGTPPWIDSTGVCVCG